MKRQNVGSIIPAGAVQQAELTALCSQAFFRAVRKMFRLPVGQLNKIDLREVNCRRQMTSRERGP